MRLRSFSRGSPTAYAGTPLRGSVLLVSLLGCTVLNSKSGLEGSARDGGRDKVIDPSSLGDGGNAGDGDTPSGDGDGHGDGDGDGDSHGMDGGMPMPVDTDGGHGPDASTGPTPIYTNQQDPTGITLVGDQLCWVGGQNVRGLYCAKAAGGGDVQTIDVPNDRDMLKGAFDLALDDSFVYWSNGVNNRVVRRGRSDDTPEEYFTGSGNIGYIVLTGGQSDQGALVFATGYSPDEQSDKNEVINGPLDGQFHQSELIYPSEARASGISVVSNTAFWGGQGKLNFGPDTGNADITRVPVDGTVTGVAVDGKKTAYFIVDDQKIYRLPRGSNTPEPIYQAEAPFGTSDIALDDQWLYWSEHDKQRLMRMKR
jgi:hypothetical protein